MVKPLVGITALVWIFGMIGFGVFWGTAFAMNVLVIGLLVIIAVNVQPKRDPDDAEYVPDADLLEDFDDPYAEPDTEPVAPAPSSVRVNPRRKAGA